MIRISLGFSVDIVQWSEDLYEEHLVDRTRDACGGHVDIVIDFSATSRSVRRAMKCLQPVSHWVTQLHDMLLSPILFCLYF